MRTFVSGGDAAGKGLAAATRPRILFVVPQTKGVFLGIASLASVLKQHGYFIDMVSPNYRMIRRYLDTSREPVILAASVVSRDAPRILSLLARLRQDVAFFSVLGGPHPTAVPEVVEEEGVDAVCRGEGEFALLELAEAMQAGTSIENIANLWVKTPRGEIRRNDVRPPIDDLDSLPFPDREMWRRTPFFDTREMPVIASRGCAFSCSYCQMAYYNGDLYAGQALRVRVRSVDNVMQEIEGYRRKFSLDHVSFVDCIFAASLGWAQEFSEKYRKCGGVPFSCNVRADLVTTTTAALLFAAGCQYVTLGIDTANETLRRTVCGKNISTQQLRNAVNILKEAGIKVRATNIIGLCDNRQDDDWCTRRFNTECRVDYAVAFPLTVLPQTPLARQAVGRKNPAVTYLVVRSLANRNLRALFGVAVEWPWLERFIKAAVNFPVTRLYDIVWRLWDAYCINVRLRKARRTVMFRSVMRHLAYLCEEAQF